MSDPRVSSIVKELRRLSPELLAEVAAEVKRALGPVTLEAQIEGLVEMHRNWLHHTSGVSIGATSLDFVALLSGERVRVRMDAPGEDQVGRVFFERLPGEPMPGPMRVHHSMRTVTPVQIGEPTFSVGAPACQGCGWTPGQGEGRSFLCTQCRPTPTPLGPS